MWHVLALALGGRTIAEWQARMTQAEFRAWCEFYRRWPFDDLHRFHRPAALVAGSMAGGGQSAMEARLDWLQPPDLTEHTSADLDLFKAAGIRL